VDIPLTQTAVPVVEHRPAAVTLLNWRNAERPDRAQEHFALTLRPGEVMALVRFREDIAGRRVLEIDCGAGRVTRYLGRWAAHVVGLDRSEALLAAAREALPRVTFHRGDALDLGAVCDAPFDTVLYVLNGIDLMAHSDRMVALAEIRRALVPGGLFVFSSHNRLGRDAREGPRLRLSLNPARLAREGLWFARSVMNRRARKPFEHEEAEYALINDLAHEYAMVHYHIDYASEIAQLARAGFEFLEAYGVDGELIGPSDDTAGSYDIHYVARRA
jgi:SAM-dependent methyltransferase